MMRPSKETSVLAKMIKGRKEPDQTTILGTQGIKTSSNFGLVFVLQIRFKALRVRAIKSTLVID